MRNRGTFNKVALTIRKMMQRCHARDNGSFSSCSISLRLRMYIFTELVPNLVSLISASGRFLGVFNKFSICLKIEMFTRSTLNRYYVLNIVINKACFEILGMYIACCNLSTSIAALLKDEYLFSIFWSYVTGQPHEVFPVLDNLYGYDVHHSVFVQADKQRIYSRKRYSSTFDLFSFLGIIKWFLFSFPF